MTYKPKRLRRAIGLGRVTGAADYDCSAVATYARSSIRVRGGVVALTIPLFGPFDFENSKPALWNAVSVAATLRLYDDTTVAQMCGPDAGHRGRAIELAGVPRSRSLRRYTSRMQTVDWSDCRTTH